jgi:uncharacterized protein YjiS (DUF1127 family)
MKASAQTITKHDRALARLVHAASCQRERTKAGAELRAMSERYSLKGLKVRTLIAEGRH